MPSYRSSGPCMAKIEGSFIQQKDSCPLDLQILAARLRSLISEPQTVVKSQTNWGNGICSQVLNF